jgi:hypothetical protein
MAFASCAMMMAAAAKMEPGPERTQMMAQALQQCGQAAQNLDAGEDNSNAADAITSAPGMPTVAKASTLKLPKEKGGKGIGSSSGTPAKSNTDSLELGGDITVPDLSQGVDVGGTGGPGLNENFEFEVTEPLDPPRALSSMDHPRIKYDEDSEGGGDTPQVSGQFQGSVGGMNSAKLGENSLRDGLEELRRGLPDRGTLDGLINGSGGGSGSSSSGKKFSLSSLMNKFGANKGGMSGAAGGDIILLPRKGKGPKKPRLNIFEYATYRYRRITYDDGRIETKIIKSSTASNSMNASKASLASFDPFAAANRTQQPH